MSDYEEITESTPINEVEIVTNKRYKFIKYCLYYLYICIASVIPVVAILDLAQPKYSRPLPIFIMTILLVITMIVLLIGMSVLMGYKCAKLKY